MAQPQQSPSPSPDRIWAFVVAAIYLATVIAVFGFISLFADRDVIDLPDAGPLVGPAMVVGAGVVTLISLVRSSRSATPWSALGIAVAGTYAAMLVIGGAAYALVRGEVLWVAFFVMREGSSPFPLTAAGLSGVTVIAFWAVSRGRALR